MGMFTRIQHRPAVHGCWFSFERRKSFFLAPVVLTFCPTVFPSSSNQPPQKVRSDAATAAAVNTPAFTDFVYIERAAEQAH
jgi:hypothetical protein